MKKRSLKRWVPSPGGNDQIVNGQIYGVWINENESVQCIRSYQPDGSCTVTGYEIVKTEMGNSLLRD